MWLQALILCCKSGGFDVPTLLKIRQLSSQTKEAVNKALGEVLSSRRWPESASFWGPPPGCDLIETGNRLRRLCAALGKPLTNFTLSYNMIVDCRSRRKIITALPLSFLAELCSVGFRVGLMVRVVSGKSNWQSASVSREFLTEVTSLRTKISLPYLTELYISGRDVATRNILMWLLQCGMPQLNRLTCVAFTGTLLRATQYAPKLINMFSSLPNLTSLNLAQNGLEGKSLQGLKMLTGLTSLNLAANPLYHDEMHYLVSVLDSLSQLGELNLSSNYFINGLTEVALAIPKTVTKLNLSSNSLGQYDVRESLANLTLPSLTWLDLSSNDLGVEGARMLPVTLLTSLTLLDLSRNGILEESPSWTPAVPWLTCYASIDDVDSKKGICLLVMYDM